MYSRKTLKVTLQAGKKVTARKLRYNKKKEPKKELSMYSYEASRKWQIINLDCM